MSEEIKENINPEIITKKYAAQAALEWIAKFKLFNLIMLIFVIVIFVVSLFGRNITTLGLLMGFSIFALYLSMSFYKNVSREEKRLMKKYSLVKTKPKSKGIFIYKIIEENDKNEQETSEYTTKKEAAQEVLEWLSRCKSFGVDSIVLYIIILVSALLGNNLTTIVILIGTFAYAIFLLSSYKVSSRESKKLKTKYNITERKMRRIINVQR